LGEISKAGGRSRKMRYDIFDQKEQLLESCDLLVLMRMENVLPQSGFSQGAQPQNWQRRGCYQFFAFDRRTTMK
jgi:hypothetical protein